MAYDGPDYTGLPEEIEQLYRAVYPKPVEQPQYRPLSKDRRIGPLSINGGALDSATLAVLQAMQNAPRSTSGAGGFAQGLVSGFAGARGRQIGQRQQEYERAVKSAEEEKAERDAFRRRAGSDLAKGRWDMYREAKESATKTPSDAYVDVTDQPDIQKALKDRGAIIPPPNKQGRIMVPSSFLSPIDPSLRGRREQLTARDEAFSKLSPEAMEFWTQRSVGLGGEIPAGLARNPKAMVAFMENTAAQAKKVGMSGFNAAEAKARFRAEANALSDVTRTAERARPFADLLHRNIGVLRGTMQKVKDTGVQWANRPVRAIIGQAGNVAQAQFNTAIVPVQKEAARLLESTTLAGVLSVDAQHEMRAVISGNYTIPQLEGVLEIIEQESKNRIEAYDEAVQNISGRIGRPESQRTQPVPGPRNLDIDKKLKSLGVIR